MAIESGLPEELDKLLQRLNLKVGDGGDPDYRGEVAEQSLGGANLIYLALKLLEYELKLSGDRVAHFLLIEEPEAHIHTHIQKTLFERQSLHRTQVIVSTHSTHISSAAKIQSVNVLARQAGHAEVYQPAAGLDIGEVQRLERYLDSVRSTLLFAKGVVLVEGSAELVLLPALVKAAFGLSPDELGISVISMDCAFFEHVAKVFDHDRIHRRCAIVTDRDTSLIPLPENPENDTPSEARARAAEIVGERRAASLDGFCADNAWVAPFFADHTLEADFLLAGNTDEMSKVVAEVYTSAGHADRVDADLNSPDRSVAGPAAIRLANKIGKGWFALLLGEKISARTYLPDYLLNAVIFAAGDSLTEDVVKRMALHRIEQGVLGADISVDATLETMPPSELISLYVTGAPHEDALSKLLATVAK